MGIEQISEAAIAPSSLEKGGGGVSPGTLKQRAREMRNNPTEPEKRLWQALKGKQLECLKFRRQQVIGQRIVDFYCPWSVIAIEVDGDTHDREIDMARDVLLRDRTGIMILRFTNEEVMRNLDGVLLTILAAAKERNHPPAPSLGRRGRDAEAAIAPSSLEEGVGGGGCKAP